MIYNNLLRVFTLSFPMLPTDKEITMCSSVGSIDRIRYGYIYDAYNPQSASNSLSSGLVHRVNASKTLDQTIIDVDELLVCGEVKEIPTKYVAFQNSLFANSHSFSSDPDKFLVEFHLNTSWRYGLGSISISDRNNLVARLCNLIITQVLSSISTYEFDEREYKFPLSSDLAIRVKTIHEGDIVTVAEHLIDNEIKLSGVHIFSPAAGTNVTEPEALWPEPSINAFETENDNQSWRVTLETIMSILDDASSEAYIRGDASNARARLENYIGVRASPDSNGGIDNIAVGTQRLHTTITPTGDTTYTYRRDNMGSIYDVEVEVSQSSIIGDPQFDIRRRRTRVRMDGTIV